MALKILLVDPDEQWLSDAKSYLKTQLYEVSTVTNGKDAQLQLYNDKFFAVFLNYDVQNHSGPQVLKFVRTNYPSQRVIIVLNDNKRHESGEVTEENLQRLGAQELMIRPFELTQLKDVLEGHQSLGDLMSNLPKKEGVSEETEVQMTDENFTSIKIDEFYSANSVLFDIYIKLNANKYLKILHAGDAFSKERIDKYKNEKKVEHLYFHNSDRRKFVQYNNFLAKKLVENQNVPAQNKVGILKNVSEKYLEEAFTVGLKPQVLDQGKEVCENVFQLVENSKDLHKLLKSFNDFDPSAYSHAFLVTLYSTAIIKQYEWQSKATIESAAMACMFHDIGKILLPKEMALKARSELTPEEFEIYKTHPELGVKVVETNRLINNSVKQIILQHHEAFDGSGFPHGKKGSKILTLANIIGLVDEFVHLMVEQKIAPTDALKKILVNKQMVARYNSNIVENFIKVFVDPDKIQTKDTVLPSNSRMVPTKKIV
ncbi:MAG: HD domain-containing protein [Bacteriovoracaceae bacterium]|nr:HD domain-containing protein [Bacteriovoracaceae bacterium]